MKKIISVLIFLIFSCLSAESAVISAYYDDLKASLYVFSTFTDRTALNEISLRDCAAEKTINFEKNARNFILSSYIPAFIIYSDNNMLKIFDLISRKSATLEAAFTKPVKYIIQSENGAYFAASDGLTVYLFAFEKNKPKIIFKKEFPGNITSLLPDDENKILYTAERNGSLASWSFDGKLISSSNIKTEASELIFDGILGRILIAAKGGIFAVDTKSLSIKPLFEDKTLQGAYLDSFSRRLIISNSSGAAIYEYPSMRAVALIPQGGGKIVKTGGSGFAAFAKGAAINLYDIKLSRNIAQISVGEKGIFFYPPEKETLVGLYGAASSFISQAAGNKKSAPNPVTEATVCSDIASAVSGVYDTIYRTSANIKNPEAAEINGVKIPYPKAPAIENKIKKPSVNFKDGTKIPEMTDKYPEPAAPKEPAPPSDKYALKEPAEPQTPSLEMKEGSGIPIWIAKAKELPYNEAAGGGTTSQEAAKDTKKKLTNSLIRALINDFIKKPETESIKNVEIKKRFLWQAASAAAKDAAEKIKIKDEWTSPMGMKYLLGTIDESNIKKSSDKYYSNEMTTLRTIPPDDYIKIKPNSIE